MPLGGSERFLHRGDFGDKLTAGDVPFYSTLSMSKKKPPRGDGNPKARSKAVKLEWQFPSDLTATFANNLVIQQDRDAWYFSFCFASPPLLFGSKEEIRAKLETIDSIPAKCVAQIVVPRECIPDFIEVIQEQARQSGILTRDNSMHDKGE